jgi:hypothetical protein
MDELRIEIEQARKTVHDLLIAAGRAERRPA